LCPVSFTKREPDLRELLSSSTDRGLTVAPH
jgi:hypothetical protein